MASKPDHLERTATEPRDKSLNTVILQHIDEINDTTRIFRLGIPPDSSPIRFLPGQWLDVYLPGVERAGGFTITSTPRDARVSISSSSRSEPNLTTTTSGDENDTSSPKGERKEEKGKELKGPYLELAIQKNPNSPQASWLWRDLSTASRTTTTAAGKTTKEATEVLPPLLGAELRVRVGGGFVWPPPGINVRSLRRVVFVAGGVGVNPLVSMLCSLAATTTSAASTATAAVPGFEVRFLYSLKDPLNLSEGDENRGEGEGEREGKTQKREARRMLFLERIARLFREGRVRGKLDVFLTGGKDGVRATGEGKQDGEGEGENEDEDRIICDGDGQEDDGEGKSGFTIPFHARRCTVEDDVAKAVGDDALADRRSAVVYVCGVPTMTDEFVAKLTDRETGLGMEPHRVLCEKWW